MKRAMKAKERENRHNKGGMGRRYRKKKRVKRTVQDAGMVKLLGTGIRNRTWRPPSQKMETRTSIPHRCRNYDNTLFVDTRV
jgi:hypothetical protein